jgi:general secretion pathway protein D
VILKALLPDNAGETKVRHKNQLRHTTAMSLAGIWAVIFLAMCSTASAEKAQSFFKEGKEQETRENYEAAYDNYLRAYVAEPGNVQYRSAITRVRFLAAASKVHRAALLRESGKLEEALKLYAAAAKIDPASPIAAQESENTRRMIQRASGQPAGGPPRSERNLSPEILDAEGPVQLAPVSALPITLKLSEDTRVIYQTIGKLAGINVLFDPDYTSRRITVELSDVRLQEALALVAAESKTFWHPMTPNTIFVATDNPAKRKELEESVIRTFYLSNISAPTELQDVVNAIRSVLDVQRVQQLVSQQAIVVRGTPDQVLLAEKMVSDFDTAPSEVVVDLAVMQVSRDKVHKLGINPPTSASVQLQSNTSTTSTSSSSSSSSTSSSSTNGISLNSLANLNATDFTATISAASFTALASDSSTKIVQQPQLRSLNGQKASLKIGSRVPTATGSTQSGIAGVSVSGLNTTQFQYLDVGVNVDVTPYIHPDGDVTLKIMLDVSSVTSYVSIGGISEPEIGQRKVEHEIRLKDGEVNLLGGMLEHTDTKSLSGVPGLSQIPIVKYFFSEKDSEVTDSEVVFALVPHIVRRRDFSELSRKTLDVGNATSIHLRHADRADTTDKTSVVVPGATPPGQATAALDLDPSAVSVAKGSTFVLNVLLTGAQDVSAVPLELSYDKSALEMINISNGDFLSQGEKLVALVHRDDRSSNAVEITASRPPGTAGVSGHGVVTSMTFMAKATGRFPVNITKGAVIQSNNLSAPASVSEITVSVQ